MNTLAKRATHMAVVSVSKVKRGAEELRGRINIENSRQLKEAGFPAGTRFKVNYQPGFVEAVKDEQGSTGWYRSPRRAFRPALEAGS
jgi:hypothetical protein